MRLEHSLALCRYFLDLFGAADLSPLKPLLAVPEDVTPDGHSFFFAPLLNRARDGGLALRLPDYDARLMAYQARLDHARGGFRLKYFQYLGALFTEMLLDRLTDDPAAFVADLNAYRESQLHLIALPPFTVEDLRRAAFFMATGSGKTLLMHINMWQLLHYLEHGRHPEVLVRRPDGRRQFDNIILVTPGEGLSEQHIRELRASGIPHRRLARERAASALFGPAVGVIEIQKLADEPARDGESIPIESLGSRNLLLVDEGHKGTGTDAQTWKRRQRALAADGFALEYSATFAQAVHAASARAQSDLLEEYGKCILFDYSYRHFYGDGYGKAFRVLNLERGREERAHDFLIGGTLAFAQQFFLYQDRADALRPYQVETPLWVFLGSRVNAFYQEAGRAQSDVATVVRFLKRFLEDPQWAIAGITRILTAESGFRDTDSGRDLFLGRLEHLPTRDPVALYDRITRQIFHGRGGLEVWEIKRGDGELGLRVSSPDEAGSSYFAVINIGDVSAFKSYLRDQIGITVKEDRLSDSLFLGVDHPASSLNILIGSKKFIEGWSCWRVSSMALINMGSGEGPQVIQLFGRGVRLKGRDWSLKRSDDRSGPHPAGLKELETLLVFGWNADYIDEFRRTVQREDLPVQIPFPVTTADPWPEDLRVPQPRRSADAPLPTWIMTDCLPVQLDTTPRVSTLEGTSAGQARADLSAPRTFGADPQQAFIGDDVNYSALVDLDALYADLLEYKASRRWGNVCIPRAQVPALLAAATVRMPGSDAADPRLVHEAALKVLRTSLDRFVARQARAEDARDPEAAPLHRDHPIVLAQRAGYTLHASPDVAEQLRIFLRSAQLQLTEHGPPIPRFHAAPSLVSPLLLDPARHHAPGLEVTPHPLNANEQRFVEDLYTFWLRNHHAASYDGRELYFLRNPPGKGVGFFQSSGFYPDFILWLQDPHTHAQHLVFVEPHGMHHGGLHGDNESKIAAFRDLRRIASAAEFQNLSISLSGWILTTSELCDIPGAEHLTWEQLATDHRVLYQDQAAHYIPRVLSEAVTPPAAGPATNGCGGSPRGGQSV